MKTKIQKFEHRSLRNKEHLQFIKLVLEALIKHDPNNLNIRGLYDELAQLIQEEEMALSVELGSSITAQREAADNRRDRMHSVLYNYVKSFLFDEEEVAEFESAQRVMRIIRQVGNPWKLADQAETSMIIQLGNELKPYQADLEQIGAQSRLDKLLVANDRFVELDKLCRDDKTNRPSGNVKSVRVKVNPAYWAIANAINADIDRFKDDRFNAVATDINSIIKDYSTLLAQRKGRNKGEPAAEA